MSSLPAGFQFSQRSLQDYVDCPRRFQLRYMEQLAWPAIESEPLSEQEQRMQAGAAFHRLVQRYLIGIPAERLSDMLAARGSETGDLLRWWENFIQHAGVAPDEGQLVEASLSAPFQGYRLVAKYDLIRWEGLSGELLVKIFDWKTSRQKPSRQWLEARLQTRLYPYLLTQSGEAIIEGERIKPDQIQMIYWFAEQPREPQIFTYTPEQLQADEAYLMGLLGKIKTLGETSFQLTADEAQCKYCIYRSLCDRGIAAGDIDEAGIFEPEQDAEGFELDFDQIAEIEF